VPTDVLRAASAEIQDAGSFAAAPGTRSAPPATCAPPTVRGAHRALAAALLWSRVLWLVLRRSRSVPGCAKLFGELRARRGRAPHWSGDKLAFASGRYFWDLYSPGWPSPAFDRFVERELDNLEPQPGRPPGLQTVVVAMTRRCALRCEHCCEWDVLNRPEALTLGELQEIVRRLQWRGLGQLFLSGGEPLLRFDDLLTLTANAAAESDVWILSSGRGLTGERANRLRAAGLTGVALSLDHWDPSVHDRFRGAPGAFDAVVAAATHARDAGLLVALSLCPTRAFVSAANLERYARTAQSMGASFIQLLEPRPVGRYAG
jgi:pyruvate-formate lyase-activating enzyme